jgi:hypothetical protein
VSGGARVWTRSATSVTEEVRARGPTQRGISQGGHPAGLELGAGWVEVALARCQTMGWSHLDDAARTEVRVVEDPPDQIRAVKCGRGTGGRWVGVRGWGKVGLGEVEEGQRKVWEDKGNAFEVGGNNVVGKGWAKGKGVIPVRVPSVAVFVTGEGKTELARGVNRMDG